MREESLTLSFRLPIQLPRIPGQAWAGPGWVGLVQGIYLVFCSPEVSGMELGRGTSMPHWTLSPPKLGSETWVCAAVPLRPRSL